MTCLCLGRHFRPDKAYQDGVVFESVPEVTLMLFSTSLRTNMIFVVTNNGLAN